MTTTAGSKGPKVPYRCSFCGKSQEQVRKLIAGQGVYICDECINLCQEIIEEELLEQPKVRPQAAKLPNPRRHRRSILRIHHATRHLQLHGITPVPVLFHHDELFIRGKRNHVHPVHRLDHVELMRRPRPRRHHIVRAQSKDPEIPDGPRSGLCPGFDHENPTVPVLSPPSLGASG